MKVESRLVGLMGCLLVAFCYGVQAETAEEKGLAIAREADRRDQGFIDSSSTLTMVLRNRNGDTSTRAMRAKILEVSDDGDKSIFVFDDPLDVKGTALLTYSHKSGADDQWLYLPALKRVKRISTKNRSGPFMGSEFAYEDMSSQEVEKFTYRYLRDEILDGREMYVLEQFPVDKKSGYTRQVVWMGKEHYRPFKVDYYDRKSTLLKTLTLSQYQQYLDKYWRALRMDMQNHQTGKSTTLEWGEFSFRNGYTDRDFTRNSLTRVR